MPLVALLLAIAFVIPPAEIAPAIVGAPDSPVKLDRAKVLNVVANEPAVLLYAATNAADYDLEHFTVIAFIFDAEGTLKARQIAPGRHMLEKGTTKFSTMVLDGWTVTPTDRVVIGVNQAQRVGSEKWWSAELESLAKASVKSK
jgi:hypothetical protein